MLDFVIVGAQKSGSTFLHYCLAEHPEVYMPRHEVHFFEDPNYAPEDISTLEQLFAGVPPARCKGIKRPRYLSTQECAPRLARHYPRAKIIAVLRNPIERAISAYYHYMRYGLIQIAPLDKGLSRLLDQYQPHARSGASEILRFGFYASHLQNYAAHYSPDNIQLLIFEEMKREPAKTLQASYRFLGLSQQDFVPSAIESQPQANIYSLARLRLLALRLPLIYDYDLNRSRTYRKQKSAAATWLDRLARSLDRRLLKPLVSDNKPSLDKVVKNRLLDLYLEDINKLESQWSLDLRTWKS